LRSVRIHRRRAIHRSGAASRSEIPVRGPEHVQERGLARAGAESAGRPCVFFVGRLAPSGTNALVGLAVVRRPTSRQRLGPSTLLPVFSPGLERPRCSHRTRSVSCFGHSVRSPNVNSGLVPCPDGQSAGEHRTCPESLPNAGILANWQTRLASRRSVLDEIRSISRVRAGIGDSRQLRRDERQATEAERSPELTAPRRLGRGPIKRSSRSVTPRM
jgi:hypothetical protein